MRRGLSIALAAAALLLAALWLSGGFDSLARWAAAAQREFQNDIALTLRGIRAGQADAFWLLLGACFAYGFFHAAGPGHGKVLIGGYGLGRKVAMGRLAMISLLSSLGQAVTAILLVYGGIWIFSLGRKKLIGVAEDVMAPISYGAIVLIGGWLVLRGLGRWREPAQQQEHHGGAVCGDCGHRHGPTAEELSRVRGLREAALLIGGIAMRPCTGALFVLIVTWQMGIAAAGLAGAVAMALGTATVTVAVGTGAIGLRGGILGGASSATLARTVLPMVEIAAGLVIFIAAGGLLLRAI